jgi:hypothetical protein
MTARALTSVGRFSLLGLQDFDQVLLQLSHMFDVKALGLFKIGERRLIAANVHAQRRHLRDQLLLSSNVALAIQDVLFRHFERGLKGRQIHLVDICRGVTIERLAPEPSS